MGHAGAWTAVGEPDAESKYQALERAGAVMVNHPEKFGEGMKNLLNSRTRDRNAMVSFVQAHLEIR
jgi:succinyl-CoA synthetase alpha subunit